MMKKLLTTLRKTLKCILKQMKMKDEIFSADHRFDGNWMNAETAEIVNVINVAEENNGTTFLILNNGESLSFDDFSKVYCQTDMTPEEIDNFSKSIGDSPSQESKSNLSESAIDRLMAGILPKNVAEKTNIDISGEEKVISEQQPKKLTLVSNNSSNEQMVSKIFDKLDIEFDICINVKKGVFPSKELVMLKDFFDVTDDEIRNVVFNKYVSKETLKKTIKEYLNNTSKDVKETDKATTTQVPKTRSRKYTKK